MQTGEFICNPLDKKVCDECSICDICKYRIKTGIDEELRKMDLNRKFRMSKMLIKDDIMEETKYPFVKYKLPYKVNPNTGLPMREK